MNNKLAYFVSKSSIFGLFYILFKYSGKDAYIGVILGTIISISIIYLFTKLKKYSNSTIFKIISTLLSIFLITIYLIIISNFINTFYLTKTPSLIITSSFILLSLYLCNKGKDTLINISNLLFYFSIVIVAIFSLLLIKYINISNLYPLFSYNPSNIIKTSIIYSLISSIPIIMVINNYKDNKYIYKHYIIASLVNLSIIVSIILCNNNSLLNIYRFPEYITLKQIRYLDFIENIENISSFGWYCEIFITISLILFNIKEILPKKNNNLYLIITSIIIIILVNFFYCY